LCAAIVGKWFAGWQLGQGYRLLLLLPLLLLLVARLDLAPEQQQRGDFVH
jgi:hypothetical protein